MIMKNMQIGYKCLNRREISRIVIDMLKASIEGTMLPINSFDLMKRFQEKDTNPTSTKLLSSKDRNYINAHYHHECSALTQLPAVETRRFFTNIVMNKDSEMYYSNKVWPLGIVMYGVEKKLRNTRYYLAIKFAMVNIQIATCVIFREIDDRDELLPKNLLWFSTEGNDMPALGFMEGNQTISLESVAKGAPGHTAHTLNALLRALGIPMMSNRHDRDNFVTVLWNHIQKGKEHYFEKSPPSATLTDQDGVYTAYSFDSATHAPANFMSEDCSLSAKTILPVQDHLWQRTLMMGHRHDLAPCDTAIVNSVYRNECQKRSISSN
ncbi:zinc metalloproteinase nas-14 isoform X1 [Bombyx mori]